MVLLLSASAFGADMPSPVSATFRNSTLQLSPPPSPPSRTTTAIAAIASIAPLPAAAYPAQPHLNTKIVPVPRSGPPTPGSIFDSDLESPHGTTQKLVLPPRKDSMRFAKPLASAVSSYSTAAAPSSASAPTSAGSAPWMIIRESPRGSQIIQSGSLTPPARSARSSPSPTRNMPAKFSLFPAPTRHKSVPRPKQEQQPTAQWTSSTLNRQPRPLLKPHRSRTEPNLQSSLRPAAPSPRSGSLPRSDNTHKFTNAPAYFPMPPSTLPQIIVKHPDSAVAANARRPSAVELIASEHATKISTGPRSYHVHVAEGPQVRELAAVTWVKKEEKYRRKLEMQRAQASLRAQESGGGVSSSSSATATAPRTPGPLSPFGPSSTPVRQEVEWAPRETHIAACMDSPTLGFSNADRSPSGLAPAVHLALPTFDFTLAAERSPSRERAPGGGCSTWPRSRHTQACTGGLEAIGSGLGAADATTTTTTTTTTATTPPRGRSRTRASTAVQSRLIVPPARGPLELRKSTFNPFRPDLGVGLESQAQAEAEAELEALRRGRDMLALAFEREKEMEREREREMETEMLRTGRIKLSGSKYLDRKPLPLPKPEAVYLGAGAVEIDSGNSPLAKLASLIR